MVHMLFIDVRHDLRYWWNARRFRYFSATRRKRTTNSCRTNGGSMKLRSKSSTNVPTR